MKKQVKLCYIRFGNFFHSQYFLEVRKAHEWLKVFTEPWSEVTKNWRICYFKRRNDINQAVDGNNIICVLDNWKLLSHSLGYTLVSIS